MNARNEQGIAVIVALFMMLAASVLGSSLAFVSQAETMSSHNYRLMSQARYGAESGVHVAVNHLLNAYAPPGSVADPLANYDATVSPVTFNGNPVVLSSDPARLSNYPVPAVVNAFNLAAQGSLNVNDAPVSYKAYAVLKSMQQFNDAFTMQPVTIQTWTVTGTGTIAGARTAEVEVISTLERQTNPIYSYAAFATDSGCSALSFAGGATTDSYDSTQPLVGGLPVLSNTFGNVGTNGNLTQVGNPTTINGSLSTPRSGVGSCSAANVTAHTVVGQASLSEGINQLSQEVSYPTPPPPNPLPPTTSDQFTQNGGCPAGVSHCSASPNGATIAPPTPTTEVMLGDVTVNGNADLHLGPGIYVMNSFTMQGSAKLVIDPGGPVIIKIAGVGQTTPLTITGDGVVNDSFNPQNLQFIYGGTDDISLAGGDQTSAVIYAPQASAAITGGSDLYGAIVVKYLTETGGAAIHYDRNLANSAKTAGNFMLSTFTWSSY